MDQNKVSAALRKTTTWPIITMGLTFAVSLISIALLNQRHESRRLAEEVRQELERNASNLASEAYLNQNEAIELRLQRLTQTFHDLFRSSQICLKYVRSIDPIRESNICTDGYEPDKSHSHQNVTLDFGGERIGQIQAVFRTSTHIFDIVPPFVFGILMVAILVALFTKWTVERGIQTRIIDPFVAEVRMKTEYQAIAAISKQVAHDIRSPVGALEVAVKALKMEGDERVSLIKKSAERIQDIANDLLSKSRAQSSRFNIVSTVRHLSDEKNSLTSHKSKILLDVRVGEVLFVSFPETDLYRILSNILNNAIEASSGAAPVKVVLDQAEKGLARVSVEDKGSGIPAEVLDKIRSGQVVTYGKENGHGLGLSHASQTLAKNGGRMDIESTLGSGTKVTIQLPLVQS